VREQPPKVLRFRLRTPIFREETDDGVRLKGPCDVVLFPSVRQTVPPPPNDPPRGAA